MQRVLHIREGSGGNEKDSQGRNFQKYKIQTRSSKIIVAWKEMSHILRSENRDKDCTLIQEDTNSGTAKQLVRRISQIHLPQPTDFNAEMELDKAVNPETRPKKLLREFSKLSVVEASGFNIMDKKFEEVKGKFMNLSDAHLNFVLQTRCWPRNQNQTLETALFRLVQYLLVSTTTSPSSATLSCWRPSV